jgi:hypothetical protein
MFLIRMMFWLSLVVLVLPTDAQQQARLYQTAVATVERITTFCDRNAKACAAGAEAWSIFLKKAEFGARVAFDLVSSRTRSNEEAPAARPQPASVRSQPEPRPAPQARGTLTPADLAPAWRGQLHKTGI